MKAEIRVGDVLDRLAEIPDESVQCVVTSPPYWGLRDYGTPGQLGLERTPEEYVEKMVAVFREVRRVLRKDGTLWLNIGDSYASSTKGDNRTIEENLASSGLNVSRDRSKSQSQRAGASVVRRFRMDGLKPKDLVGIPWRLAFALQADGWWLRSDIIWNKPNPMPESVTDRPTKAHEYVFLLTKSARYYYDQDAVREAALYEGDERHLRADSYKEPDGPRSDGGSRFRTGNPVAGRNLRTVWTIATQPFPEAHFATFPEELAERCIKAGTSERGACPECGAGWRRVTVVGYERKTGGYGIGRVRAADPRDARSDVRPLQAAFRRAATTGWSPSCDHGSDPITCTVLDPFAGSGTTGVVALALQRSFIGIELNPAYAEMSRRRLESVAPLLSETTVTPPAESEQSGLFEEAGG